MLEVKGLIKDYKTGFFGKKVRVLNGVDLDVNDGEIFGFIGPNGAGKTTTFKSILNFVSITEGSIQIKGKDFKDTNIKKSIGYLPESPYFYDYLTGGELLTYMGKLHCIDNDILGERINVLLEKVNMSYARNRQLRKYSKGMQQRIGIAQALINDPDFIILDEPMSGLDPMGRREVRDLILEEKEKGKTILLSSHILSDVESLCDRVGVILNGKVVNTGILAELYNKIKSDYEMQLNCNVEDVINVLGKLEITLTSRAGFTIIRFNEDIKNKILELLLTTSIEIISLQPISKSLEGLFEMESN